MSLVGCCVLQNVAVFIFSMLYLNPSLSYLLKNCTIPFSENRSNSACINIDCSQRKLLVVPDGIPRGVTRLSIYLNQIQAIHKNDFRYLSNLTVLNLAMNQIAHIEDGSFIDLLELRELNIAMNELTKLSNNPFEGLWKLTVLDLSRNRIRVIPPSAFGSMSSLHWVDLDQNLLTEMTDIQYILQLPHIDYISISDNPFSSFETKHLPLNMSSSLRGLTLSSTVLTIFSITTPVFPHLEKLSFNGLCPNPVMEVDIPEPRFFRTVTHLQSSTHCISFKDMRKLLESLVSLTHLELSDTEKWINRGLLKTACSIPSLRSLDLHYNSVVNIAQKLPNCSQITKLDLFSNRISNLSSHSIQSMKQLRYLDLAGNSLSSVPHDLISLSSLEILYLSANNIAEVGCLDFFNLTRLKELYLVYNYIDKLDGCVFQYQKDLKVLDLSNNLLLELDDTFKIGLKNLEFLDLSTNRIKHFGTGDFISLESLSCLKLNIIEDVHSKDFERLYTPSLSFLLQMDNIFSGLQLLRNLTVYLNIPEGYKGVDLNSYQNLINLPSLRYLDIICRGMHCSKPFHVPIHFLKTMKNLEHLTAENFQLVEPDKDTFIYTPKLKSLAITVSSLSDLNPELFQPIPNLEVLDLSRNTLKNLDFLAQANLTSLRCLKLCENELTVIDHHIFQFLPALTYLDLSVNPLTCDCSNSGFLLWALSSDQTQIVNVDQYVCTYPLSERGTMFVDVDVHSCWMDASFLCYISTTGLVLLTLLTAFGHHFLHWRLVYAYYRLMALLYDMRERKRNNPCRYDAFISYNVQDEAWVHGEMLPALEDERGWRLCLHHRDFQPGRSIMENITEAIYGSRKTICVISRHYLESEWCSREIQMASYRLLDEKKDVLILLFLEELPEKQLSPYYRMRKLVRRSTYLSWPQAARHPGLFWQNVHRALESGDSHDDNTHFLSGPAL
ncbi:unnamed protein product [Arctogadus glacialis]